jgi:hypothetical protein
MLFFDLFNEPHLAFTSIARGVMQMKGYCKIRRLPGLTKTGPCFCILAIRTCT